MSPLPKLLARAFTAPMPIVAAHKLKRLARRIDDESAQALDLWNKLGEQFALKDERGIPKLQENGTHVVPPEKQADYDREFGAFLAVEFDTGIQKFKASDFDALKVSPVELLHLEALIESLA